MKHLKEIIQDGIRNQIKELITNLDVHRSFTKKRVRIMLYNKLSSFKNRGIIHVFSLSVAHQTDNRCFWVFLDYKFKVDDSWIFETERIRY